MRTGMTIIVGLIVAIANSVYTEVIVSNTTWSSSFDGWNVNGTPVATNDTGSGDFESIEFNVGSISSAWRSYIFKEPGYGENTAMGANELNYYQTPLRITWEISSVIGTPGSGQNQVYLGLMNQGNRARYYPGNNTFSDGLYFSLTRYHNDSSDVFAIDVLRTDGTNVFSIARHDLDLTTSIAPDRIVIDLDGSAYGISVTGTTFDGGSASMSGTLTGIDESSYDEYGLVVGAVNSGKVSAATGFTLERVIVETVPMTVEINHHQDVLSVVWRSMNGKTYDLESCTSLTSLNWTVYGGYTNIAATAPTNSLDGIAADSPVRFFRIIEK